MVEMAARLEIQPEVKTSAASLPCRSASSASSMTSGWLVPEILRVPPAPAPCLAVADFIAAITSGLHAHAEIVVGAPDRDVMRGAVVVAPDRVRETFGIALDIGKDTVTLFGLQLADRILEELRVTHGPTLV